MTAHHAYQRDACSRFGHLGPILNAACKEDPARLGSKFGAINLDIEERDRFTRTILSSIPHFVRGSVYDLGTIFEADHFGFIVLGEFLEHAVFGAGLRALRGCRAVLKKEGRLCLTFPLDSRPPDFQHAKNLLFAHVKGKTGHDVTSYHQTVWTEPNLERLFRKARFEVEEKTHLHYGFVGDKHPQGWGMILRKTTC